MSDEEPPSALLFTLMVGRFSSSFMYFGYVSPAQTLAEHFDFMGETHKVTTRLSYLSCFFTNAELYPLAWFGYARPPHI